MPDLGTRSIENWPLTSRESAQRIIDQYGEPDEVTDSQLVWHKRGPWRQIVASKILYHHNFPAPHYALFEFEPKQEDAVEPKPQRTRSRHTVKTKLHSLPGYDKATLAKASLARSALSKSSLAAADLAKADLMKSGLALRNKSVPPSTNSSAA